MFSMKTLRNRSSSIFEVFIPCVWTSVARLESLVSPQAVGLVTVSVFFAWRKVKDRTHILGIVDADERNTQIVAKSGHRFTSIKTQARLRMWSNPESNHC